MQPFIATPISRSGVSYNFSQSLVEEARIGVRILPEPSAAGEYEGLSFQLEIVRETEVTGVRLAGHRVAEVQTTRGSISTPVLVNAAGPYVAHVGRLLGVELPVFCERHAKIAFDDAFAKYSPGALLELENIRAAHANPEIHWLDSLAAPGHELMTRLWLDRLAIVTMLVAPGGLGADFVVGAFPLLRSVKRLLRR